MNETFRYFITGYAAGIVTAVVFAGACAATVINKETNEEQEHTEFTEPFEYEVYTDNKDKYYIKVCVCDDASIKTIANNKVETENAEPQAF